VPGFCYNIQDLLAGVQGSVAHGIAHAPGEAAGDGLPFVGAVLCIHGSCNADIFVRHTQGCGSHLCHDGERPLSNLLSAQPDRDVPIFCQFHPGA